MTPGGRGGDSDGFFSFDFADMHDAMRRPSTMRHYETKGHHLRHRKTHEIDIDDDFQDDEDGINQAASTEGAPSETPMPSKPEPEAAAGAADPTTSSKRPHKHRHHHHHRNRNKNDFDYDY